MSPSTGVPGLTETPGHGARARGSRDRVRCRCGEASACTVTMSAPASRYQLDRRVDVVDHEVHVERLRGDPLDRLDHRRADREVGHEVPVHHVDVDEVGSAVLDERDLPRQAA